MPDKDMFEGLDRAPILHALRMHVDLDADVSDALAALYAREGARVAELLRETRVLAGQLDPSKDGIGSRLDLERWLATILRGPHDRTWFDARIRCGREGWADMRPLAATLLIARVRDGLIEISSANGDQPGAAGHRVTNALGRLFDLEMAIVILDVEFGAIVVLDRDGADPIRSASREAAVAVGNMLAVIETSAQLIRRYFDLTTPRRADIERHLQRIAKQIDGARTEVRQLLEAAMAARSLMH